MFQVVAIMLLVTAMALALPATASSPPNSPVTPVVGMWLVNGEGPIVGPAW